MALLPVNRLNPWLQKRYHTRLPRRAFVGGYIRSEYLPWYKDGWSPTELFANGEQGVWYDPSDLSTLFSDHLARYPASFGSPVGLMLDKSRGGLGPELVVGGGPFIKDSDANLTIPLKEAVDPGKTFIVRLDIVDKNVSNPNVVMGGLLTTWTMADTGNMIRTAIHTPTASTQFLGVNGASARLTVVKASVREISGNHASQPTVTARPTLMQDADGKAYLDFDGVDDRLMLATPLHRPNVDWMQGFRRSTLHTMAMLSNTNLSAYIWAMAQGTSTSINNNAGTPQYFANGEQVTVLTRRGLSDAIPLDTRRVLEARGADLTNATAWSEMGIGYVGWSEFKAHVYGVIMRDAMTADERGAARQWLADRSGVTL